MAGFALDKSPFCGLKMLWHLVPNPLTTTKSCHLRQLARIVFFGVTPLCSKGLLVSFK